MSSTWGEDPWKWVASILGSLIVGVIGSIGIVSMYISATFDEQAQQWLSERPGMLEVPAELRQVRLDILTVQIQSRSNSESMEDHERRIRGIEDRWSEILATQREILRRLED